MHFLNQLLVLHPVSHLRCSCSLTRLLPKDLPTSIHLVRVKTFEPGSDTSELAANGEDVSGAVDIIDYDSVVMIISFYDTFTTFVPVTLGSARSIGCFTTSNNSLEDLSNYIASQSTAARRKSSMSVEAVASLYIAFIVGSDMKNS